MSKRSGVIYFRNRAKSSQVTFVASSEQSSFGVRALTRDGRNDRVRWKQGWDVILDVNDAVPFLRGTNKLGLIAPGNYPTPGAYATAVAAAMNAADANSYVAAQNAGTGVWTISGSAAFSFRDAAAVANRNTFHGDMGFDNVATSSATSQVGVRAAWQSRKWLNIDLGAQQDVSWTIDATNNKIDFNRGGVKVASIGIATYPNGAALAVAIVAALTAADSGITWYCVYNESTGSFTISGSANFNLLTNTGANKSIAVWTSIGFSTAADKTGTSTYSSDTTSHGNPVDSIDLIMLTGHNIAPGTPVRLDTDVASMLAIGLYKTITFTQLGTSDPSGRTDLIRIDLSTPRSERYLRLVIDATASGSPNDTVTYLELGVLFLGETFELPGINPALTDGRESLTTINYAVNGAHSAAQRTSRRVLHLTIQTIDDADKAVLEEFLEDTGIGGSFFFSLDPDDTHWDVRYVFLRDEWSFDKVPERNGSNRLWTVDAELPENLG